VLLPFYVFPDDVETTDPTGAIEVVHGPSSGPVRSFKSTRSVGRGEKWKSSGP